jgi:hypothetical protein
LSLSNEDIVKLIEGYEKESKAYREESLRLCWYMRGGLTYDESMMLTIEERDIIGKIIKDNMEVTKKSGLNFF